LSCGPRLAALDTNQVLNTWLAAQTNLLSWSADFRQTRTLKTLTTPLDAVGQVWFAAPNRFRWELGLPPQTIAVRQPGQVWILYPRLKRAESYPLDADAAGPWKDAMALLDAGFPRSRVELEQRFVVKSLIERPDRHEFSLEPRAPQARRFLPEIRIGFSKSDALLLSTEMTFVDGSRLRNEFTHIRTNAPVDPALFEPNLPPDWTVSRPTARGSRGASPP